MTGLVEVRRDRVAEAVFELTLRPVSGEPVEPWTPGAHLELEIGPEGLVRHYSLCGDPADRSSYRVAVLHEPSGRGGSAALHAPTVPSVMVRSVRNHFPFATAPAHVFVAGGIGITPLVPMLAAADAAGADWVLHYAGRARAGMAFADRLVDRYGDRVRLYADGERLSVSAALAAAPAGAVVHTCGPAGLMRDVVDAGQARGLVVHRELFAAEAVEATEDEASFEVHFARTGVSVVVGPGESILDAGEAAGADVFGSCTEGICGTCETKVLEGVPRHRDSVLSGDETDTMMVCVSRAAGARLVLDA